MKLRVWHIPQIPMKAFYVPVDSIDEAKKIISILWDYDDFQFKNNKVFGGAVKHITEEEMQAAIRRLTKGVDYQQANMAVERELAHTYCKVQWGIPYYRAAGTFLSETIWRLMRLGNPEDVRIVFWFDN